MKRHLISFCSLCLLFGLLLFSVGGTGKKQVETALRQSGFSFTENSLGDYVLKIPGHRYLLNGKNLKKVASAVSEYSDLYFSLLPSFVTFGVREWENTVEKTDLSLSRLFPENQ